MKCNGLCLGTCYGLMRCQCETVSKLARMCNYISVHVYKTQHVPRLWSLNMVQLSTEVQLIKAVVLLKCNVLDSAKKKQPKIVILCDIIRKCYRGNTHRNHSGDHNKGIACRYVVASNRAQVVRSYTCVTTTQAIFPHPLSPAPIVIIERVSHLSHCIEHLCPDTQPSLDSLVLPGVLHHLVQDWRLFALQLLAAQSRSVHPLRHHLPKSLFHLTPDRSTASAVAACG